MGECSILGLTSAYLKQIAVPSECRLSTTAAPHKLARGFGCRSYLVMQAIGMM